MYFDFIVLPCGTPTACCMHNANWFIIISEYQTHSICCAPLSVQIVWCVRRFNFFLFRVCRFSFSTWRWCSWTWKFINDKTVHGIVTSCRFDDRFRFDAGRARNDDLFRLIKQKFDARVLSIVRCCLILDSLNLIFKILSFSPLLSNTEL